MTDPCDSASTLNSVQRAEFHRVERLTRSFSASVLSEWERRHQLRDPFYIASAWCDGRFHFYEAKIVGEVFDKVTTDCPRWKAEARPPSGGLQTGL